ncbi:putative membrane protein [Peptoniphilus sp. ING2-D1G]|nr:putative membrane protein [Peptoniphilus sp. ING2-D1G]
MKKVWEHIKNFLGFVASISTLIVGISIIAQIFFRFFLGTALTWSEELAQIFLIVLVFTGLATVETNDEHLQIEILFSIFPKYERLMKTIGKILTIIFCISVVFSAINILPAAKFIRAKASGLPIKYVYYAMLVGSGAWLIQCVINLIKLNKGGKSA